MTLHEDGGIEESKSSTSLSALRRRGGVHSPLYPSPLRDRQVIQRCEREKITWDQFFQTSRPVSSLRYRQLGFLLVRTSCCPDGAGWKAVGASTPPPLTRFGVSLLTLDSHFDTQKADQRLGFAAIVHHKDGLRQTLIWIRDAGLLRPGDRIRNDLWA